MGRKKKPIFIEGPAVKAARAEHEAEQEERRRQGLPTETWEQRGNRELLERMALTTDEILSLRKKRIDSDTTRQAEASE